VQAEEKRELRLKERLSQTQDADLPTLISEIAEAEQHYEALLLTQARFPRRSLFEFLG
jgi:hypothetical protein